MTLLAGFVTGLFCVYLVQEWLSSSQPTSPEFTQNSIQKVENEKLVSKKIRALEQAEVETNSQDKMSSEKPLSSKPITMIAEEEFITSDKNNVEINEKENSKAIQKNPTESEETVDSNDIEKPTQLDQGNETKQDNTGAEEVVVSKKLSEGGLSKDKRETVLVANEVADATQVETKRIKKNSAKNLLTPVKETRATQQSKSTVSDIVDKKNIFSMAYVQDKNWVMRQEPVVFLPSKINTCSEQNNKIICNSSILEKQRSGKIIRYKVKAIIKKKLDSVDSIQSVYRNLVLDVTNIDSGSKSPPVKKGWSLKHIATCTYEGDDLLQCVIDGSRSRELRVDE